MNEEAKSIYYSANLAEYKEACKEAIKMNKVLFARGSPGIGKTSIAYDICKEVGRKPYIIRLVGYELNDLTINMPDPVTGAMRQYVTKSLPNEPGGVLILDEYLQAPTTERRPLRRLLEEGKLGDTYQLPPNTAILVLSNKNSDVQVEDIESDENGRFFFKLEVTPTKKEIEEWFSNQPNGHTIIGYLRTFPEDISVIDPESNISILNPREYAKLTQLSDLRLSKYVLPEGYGVKFDEFRKKIELFTDINGFVKGTKPFPSDISDQIAVVTAIVSELDRTPKYKEMFNDIMEMKTRDADEETLAMMLMMSLKTYAKRTKCANLKQVILQMKDADTRAKIIGVLNQYQYLSPEYEVKEA